MSSSNLLLDLHTDLSRGRSVGLVFPSLEEFSTVYCDPHSQRLWRSQESRSRCFSGTLLLFLWSSGCWQFDLWFICLFFKSSLNIWKFTSPFHYRGLECKSMKSRDTWSNRQIWPWSTEWSRAKANRVLPRKRTGHSKHPLPTTQEKTTHGRHQMVNTKIRLIIFFAAKDGEALYSQQKQDWELTVAQIMNSLLPNSDLNWRK